MILIWRDTFLLVFHPYKQIINALINCTKDETATGGEGGRGI